MLVVIGIVLIVFWLMGLFIFKVTKGIIHVVLLIAVVVIVLHFVRAGHPA